MNEAVKEARAASNLEKLLARRTRHGKLEYECKFWGAGHDENEWRSLERLSAEGLAVVCKRFDQVPTLPTYLPTFRPSDLPIFYPSMNPCSSYSLHQSFHRSFDPSFIPRLVPSTIVGSLTVSGGGGGVCGTRPAAPLLDGSAEPSDGLWPRAFLRQPHAHWRALRGAEGQAGLRR